MASQFNNFLSILKRLARPCEAFLSYFGFVFGVIVLLKMFVFHNFKCKKKKLGRHQPVIFNRAFGSTELFPRTLKMQLLRGPLFKNIFLKGYSKDFFFTIALPLYVLTFFMSFNHVNATVPQYHLQKSTPVVMLPSRCLLRVGCSWDYTCNPPLSEHDELNYCRRVLCVFHT